MPVPSFTLDGILPPFTGEPTDGATMSPFKVTVLEFVASFALTRQRVQILEGFLEFRRRIHELGITRGVQWIDGSFVEMNDAIRAPRDVDIVTFFFRPASLADRRAWEAAIDAHPDVFEHGQVKTDLRCDSYWVDLSVPAPLYHVDQTRYWFGLFSHRRATQQWKGMLELPLGSLAEDHEAANLLRSHDDPQD
jgi:hypothetical protein